MNCSSVLNIENNEFKITSILYLQILLFLSYRKGFAFFKDLQKYLDKSKSQISVALKKLENNKLISRNNTRPQKILITKKGINAKNNALRKILKFKKYPTEKLSKSKANNFNNSKTNYINSNLKKEKILNFSFKREEIIKKLIKEINSILKKELNEDFGNKVPDEILSFIRLEIKNKIHDKLYEFF